MLSVSILILTLGFLIPPKLVALDNKRLEVPLFSRGWSAPSTSLSQPAFSLLNSRDFHASATAAKRFAFLEMNDIGERDKHQIISNISSYLEKNGDAGIALNFEEMLPASKPRLFHFLQDLRGTLRGSNRGVILIVPFSTERGWMQSFAQVADYILVPLYNNGGGRPEPLASQGWFESRLAVLAATVDSSKLIIGLGSFGCDFGRPSALSKISIPFCMVSSEKE